MAASAYDMIISDGGPAGITVGRSRFKTLLLENLITGHQATITDLVDNYPGFSDGLTGYELSQACEARPSAATSKSVNC